MHHEGAKRPEFKQLSVKQESNLPAWQFFVTFLGWLSDPFNG